MLVNLTLHCDTASNNKKNIVCDLSDALKKHFKDKNYGDDVEHIIIGIMTLKLIPGFERFQKPMKAQYILEDKNENISPNIPPIKKCYTYQIRLEDYEPYVKKSSKESLKILKKELIKSLDKFNRLPKKIKKFDKNKFIEDFREFLDNYKLKDE
jgi:hypothetical protein